MGEFIGFTALLTPLINFGLKNSEERKKSSMDQVLSILIELGVDHTFYYQLALIIFLFITLSHFVWKPFLQIAELRDEKTEKTESRAKELGEKSQAALVKYREKIGQVHLEAVGIFNDIKTTAKAQEKKWIEEAEGKFREEMKVAKSTLERELTESMDNLQLESNKLGNEMAEKFLGRNV